MRLVLRAVSLAFALCHLRAAGFGLWADHGRMGWHLAGLFALA
ncbi:hypothetical protein PVT71_17555 [Salipiger sp. H15]|uniref:Uncharacterized protein n=1 Tax=Alloyangia sp. H15 TaxID=3029062 RepID=A0AAU8AP47_9RHOB